MIKNVFALYNVQKHNPALKQQKGQKKRAQRKHLCAQNDYL